MKISNQLYDILKYVAMILIPALVVLVLTVGKIWNLPYYDNIGATISAIGVFLGSLLGLSSYEHNKPYPMDISGLEYIDAVDEEAADEGADVDE